MRTEIVKRLSRTLYSTTAKPNRRRRKKTVKEYWVNESAKPVGNPNVPNKSEHIYVSSIEKDNKIDRNKTTGSDDSIFVVFVILIITTKMLLPSENPIPAGVVARITVVLLSVCWAFMKMFQPSERPIPAGVVVVLLSVCWAFMTH